MSTRVNMYKAQPDAIKAMMGLSKYVSDSGLKAGHAHLIKIRASQINGCAYCINMHTRDARKDGETDQRMHLLNAWRETSLYSDEERAVLALTEEVTLISKHAVDGAYETAASLFSETYLTQIIMAIVTINAWNRIAITTQMQPD